MAYPVVENSATSDETDRSTTTFSMNLPTGIEYEDVLLAFATNWDNGGSNQISFPSDWVEVVSAQANEIAYSVYAYWADGTETGTISVTVNDDEAAGRIYRISGAQNPNYESPIGVSASNKGGAFPPGGSQFSAPSLNYLGLLGGPWGRYDQYLGFVSYHYEESMNGVIDYPDNYSNPVTVDSGGGTGTLNVGVTSLHRDIQSLGEFSSRWRLFDNSNQSRANTVVVVPPRVRYVPPSTFPYINKVAFSQDSQRVTSTTFKLILPPLEPGDVIIAITATRDAAEDTVTWPAGWTELYDVKESSSLDINSSAAWKKADGSEGRTITLTVDANPTVGMAFTVANVPDPEPTVGDCFEWNQSSGVAQVHGAGSITPAAGSDNYLWVGVYATRDDNGEFSGFPVDYDGRTVVKSDWPVNSEDVTICLAHSNDETARTELTSNYLTGGSALASISAQFVFYPGSFDPGHWWYLNWRHKSRNAFQ